jgi:hypothetical protein
VQGAGKEESVKTLDRAGIIALIGSVALLCSLAIPPTVIAARFYEVVIGWFLFVLGGFILGIADES